MHLQIFLLLGFNSTDTKIRTPDGKIWKEEEFHNLSREIYRDLSQQFAGKDTTQTSSYCCNSLFVTLFGLKWPECHIVVVVVVLTLLKKGLQL